MWSSESAHQARVSAVCTLRTLEWASVLTPEPRSARTAGQTGRDPGYGTSRLPKILSTGRLQHFTPLKRCAVPRATVVRQCATVLSGSERIQTDSAGRAVSRRIRLTMRLTGERAEGERFELSIRLTTDNGFRDRRIRPLCHPSAGGRRTAAGAALAEKEGFEPSMEPFSPITP